MSREWLLAISSIVMAALVPGLSRAAVVEIVENGADYFQTLPGSSFNFGGSIGPVAFVGNPIGPGSTDTIVQRLSDAPIGGTVPIQMVALSLKSVFPVNVGGNFFDVFVKLDPANLANDTGTIAIHGSPLGGTFDSSLHVFFDARFQPLGGGAPFDVFNSVSLSQTGAAWSSTPSANDVIVQGPDTDAGPNGDNPALDLHSPIDPGEVDFFLTGSIQEISPNGDIHVVGPARPTPGPEPASLILVGGGLAAIAAIRRRTWRV